MWQSSPPCHPDFLLHQRNLRIWPIRQERGEMFPLLVFRESLFPVPETQGTPHPQRHNRDHRPASQPRSQPTWLTWISSSLTAVSFPSTRTRVAEHARCGNITTRSSDRETSQVCNDLQQGPQLDPMSVSSQRERVLPVCSRTLNFESNKPALQSASMRERVQYGISTRQEFIAIG